MTTETVVSWVEDKIETVVSEEVALEEAIETEMIEVIEVIEEDHHVMVVATEVVEVAEMETMTSKEL
jgi:hypothetical protein